MGPQAARLRLQAAVEERYVLYDTVVPGGRSFRCQPDGCCSQCCRLLTVVADEADTVRLEAGGARNRTAFLECESGRPIRLPLAQPFVLSRRSGACILLGDGGACGAYGDRPNGCRSYPFEVRVIGTRDGRERRCSLAGVRAALEQEARGEVGDELPLLMRHRDCPGFTGPALAEAEWRSLVLEVAGLRAEGRET